MPEVPLCYKSFSEYDLRQEWGKLCLWFEWMLLKGEVKTK